ncbi:MAG: Gfo/Idh/MocA family oxidoreductase [Dehalococcoidia bacterium]|nr:Gfo/Idh/MocA family oxidoreductase [Dehalococcoidia bacterium]
MATQPLRIAVIGAGANTRLRHIPGFQALPGVEIAAVCNRTEASGRAVADVFAIPRVETDALALLRDPDIDAVCIGTWPYRHHAYALVALAAGKHVLCEARMAMNAAEARDLLAAADARPDRVAQLVPAPSDLRWWRTVRRLLAEGALGPLREVHATMLGGGALDPAAPLHWRERDDYSGYNTMSLGILAETVERWLGPTERVLADAATFTAARTDAETGRPRAVTIPDSLGVLARMPDGTRVTYRVSAVTAGARGANGISLFGAAASLHLSFADDTLTLVPLRGQPQPLAPDPGTDVGWAVERDFVASIRTGAPVELTSFADGLRYMRFTEAVWRSWNEARPLYLADV